MTCCRQFDLDGDGQISAAELEQALKAAKLPYVASVSEVGSTVHEMRKSVWHVRLKATVYLFCTRFTCERQWWKKMTSIQI